MSAAISGALIPHIAALIRGLVLQVPHIAEPVITVRAQLRSTLGAPTRDPLAHPGYQVPTKTPRLAPRDFRFDATRITGSLINLQH